MCSLLFLTLNWFREVSRVNRMFHLLSAIFLKTIFLVPQKSSPSTNPLVLLQLLYPTTLQLYDPPYVAKSEYLEFTSHCPRFISSKLPSAQNDLLTFFTVELLSILAQAYAYGFDSVSGGSFPPIRTCLCLVIMTMMTTPYVSISLTSSHMLFQECLCT